MNEKPLPILQRGAALLSEVAQPVTDISANKTQHLIKQLKHTVKSANGVGIAAPQVGVSLRLFIICSAPSERYPNAPLLPPSVIINPEILSHSSEQALDWEGCLSVKGKRALVARYKTVEVCYFDEHQHRHQQSFNGFLARIFQHELDHLNGITFIERLENEDNAIDEQQWREQFL